MPKLVELYGEVTGISSGSEALIISWQVPTGYAAELIGVGVIPDYDPTTGASYLDKVMVAAGDSANSVGKKFEHSNFSAKYGKNILSYGNETTEQPLFMFERHLMPGSLTYKFAPGKYIQIVGYASGGTTGKVKARALVYLLEEDEVMSIYGVGLSEFASLPGGHNQSKPVLLYAEYFDNPATTGNSKWEDLASISLESYEVLRLTHIGVIPHDNADALKIIDNRTKEEFPDREPYWKITQGVNVLPFGGDDSRQPIRQLPAFIQLKEWTQTTLKIQVRDTGTAIPAGGVRVQVFGVYEVR